MRPIESPQDLPIQFQDITAAIAEGRITPGEGASLSNILTSHARTMELVELDRRMAALEAHEVEVKLYRRELNQFLQEGWKKAEGKPGETTR